MVNGLVRPLLFKDPQLANGNQGLGGGLQALCAALLNNTRAALYLEAAEVAERRTVINGQPQLDGQRCRFLGKLHVSGEAAAVGDTQCFIDIFRRDPGQRGFLFVGNKTNSLLRVFDCGIDLYYFRFTGQPFHDVYGGFPLCLV